MTFVWLAFFDALLAVTMVAVGLIAAHFYLVPAFMGFQLFALGFLLSILGASVGLLAIYLTRTPRLRAGRNAVSSSGTTRPKVWRGGTSNCHGSCSASNLFRSPMLRSRIATSDLHARVLSREV